MVRRCLLDALGAVIAGDTRGDDSAISINGRLDTGRSDDKKAVVLGLNAISRWKEGIEAFDEVGVAAEQFRNTLDDARGVDAWGHGGESGELENRRNWAYIDVLKSFIMSRK